MSPPARWLGLYIVLVLAPVAAALVVEPPARSTSWPVEAAAAVGLAALAVLIVQLALISRFGRLSRDVGLDALMQFHREMAVVAMAAVAAHVLLLGDVGGGWRALNPFGGPAASATGALSLWALLAVALTSFGRRRLRLSYEAWQVVHVSGALLIVIAAIAHAGMIGRYSGTPLVLGVLVLYGIAFPALLAWSRLVRRLRHGRASWELIGNEDVGGSTRLLTLQPVGHAGFGFQAGQFAWVITGRSPVLSQQHPLSIASAPSALQQHGRIQFAVKALGDWSGTVVPHLARGHRLWIDGPYGAFTPAPHDGPLVLIAGGIGIVPIRSILLAARTASARRPITVIYAAASTARVVFHDELTALARELPFELVIVLEHPPEGWTGERGFITADIIRRHSRGAPHDAEYFICGPLPMIDAFDRIRRELGIPRRSVHTERFHLV